MNSTAGDSTVPAQVPNLERFYALARRLDATAAHEYRAELDRLQGLLAENTELLNAEIQKRRQSEQAAAQRFQGIVETSLEAISLVDASGIILYTSPAARQIVGFTPEELVGRSMFDLMHPDQIEEHQRLLGHLLANPSSTVTTVCLVHHSDGTWRWVESVAINALAVPSIQAIVVHFRDITEKKQAEEALRQINEQLEQRVRERTLEVEAGASRIQAILDTAVDAILTMDPDGTIRTFNRAAEKMFGYAAVEMIGANLRRLREALARDQDAGSPGHLMPDLGSGLDAVGVRKNGERFPMEMIISESRLGKQRWFTGFFRDITERKQAEESMRIAKEAAEAANRAKSEFLANMSHEIRTPMNGILGMAELMLEMELSPDQREFVSAIQSSGLALLTVINDILDFSKIEAGKLEFDRIEFSLRETLGDAVKSLALKAHRKNVKVTCEVAPDIADDLSGDPYRLRQVLVNLIDNAVKFTEQGKVTVAVTQLPVADCRMPNDQLVSPNMQSAICSLQFSISDTGIGISPEEQGAIFRPFVQADGSITRKYGGTGLGLTISKQLIERMGGRIWVESEVGRGSRFHFTASFAIAEVKARETLGSEISSNYRSGVSGLHILLAEDNPINQTVAVHMLQRMGHRVTVVDNGQGAVEATAHQAFDLVLMDVQMPGMDGYEATAKIRTRERDTGGRLPIIAITAHAMKGIQEQCLAAGMDGYVTKPMRAKKLLQAIASVRTDVPAQDAGHADKSPVDAILDRRALLERIGYRRDLVGKMAALFRTELPRMLAPIQQACTAGDARALELAAHGMKGAVGNLGAIQAHAVAGDIERWARQKQMDKAAPLVAVLTRDLARLQSALEDFGNEGTQ